MDGREVSLLAAFFAGAVSFVSPCVLPVLPGYLAVLAGTDGGRAGEGRRFIVNTACFFAGFTVVFLIMGVTASLLGRLFLEHQAVVRKAGAVFIFLMGLHLTGLLRLTFLVREARLAPVKDAGGPLGAFALGLALTAGWTPCVGPILASILAYAGIAGTAGYGALLLLAYAAGFAAPFLAFTALYKRYSAQIRARYHWLPLIQHGAGAALAATGVLLYFDLMAAGLGFIYGYWPW